MGELPTPGSGRRDGTTPSRKDLETPFSFYVGGLVRDYISYGKSSPQLQSLLNNGIPDELRSQPHAEKRNFQGELRDVLFTVLETYGFWGDILMDPNPPETAGRSRHQRRADFTPNQGLPHLNVVKLEHSLRTVENPTVRFTRNNDDSIVVRGTYYNDIAGRGFLPDFMMAYQFLKIGTSGRTTLNVRFWPEETDANAKQKQQLAGFPQFSNLPREVSPATLKYLLIIALNGAKLQERGHIYERVTSRNSSGAEHTQIKQKPQIFT